MKHILFLALFFSLTTSTVFGDSTKTKQSERKRYDGINPDAHGSLGLSPNLRLVEGSEGGPVDR